jgi:ornithine cyclodeaminase/alanine dehydrogenase-like protein (mu-crystallin family)
MSHEVIFLSDCDVQGMLTMSKAIAAVEEDFKRQADPTSLIYGVPLAYETEDRKLGFRWRLKTAVVRDLSVAGARVTGHKIDSAGIGSAGERGSTRYMILSDPATSSPLAIIDEHTSFGMRTSAAVCVAAKYLARQESNIAGIIGVGNLGRNSLVGLHELFQLQEVRVTSARQESRCKFAQDMSAALGLPVKAMDSYEEVCRGADIIVAGTPSVAPFIRYDWLKDGVFIGVMGQEEATHEVYAKCDCFFVDYDPATQKHPLHIQQAVDSGAIGPETLTGQIWEIVSGRKRGRRDAKDKILVATVGLTSQDIAIAYELYLRAKIEGRGLRLPF